MDVTNGLISRLVKSKSTERVLAPIASQVSLLMILKEVEGEESGEGSALNVSACVDRVTKAVDGFIQVGQDQIHHSADPIFDSQMQAACETLELAKSQLYVAGQSMGAQSHTGFIGSTPCTNHSLVHAAKDLLQAILRVLIIVDDVEVRRCVQAVTVVENKVKNVCSLSDARDMVSAFKELTESMLYMTMMVSRRQKDLVSGSQRDHLMTDLSLTRKAMSSLRMAVQTHLKYPSNPQAEAGKLQVLDQIVSTLGDLRSVLESGPPNDLQTEEAGHFVHHIDQVLEVLDEAHRYNLTADLEVWVASIVRHAMAVAHLCQGTYRHLITRTCQRILQSKFRLFELQAAVLNCPNLSDVRVDYEEVCEVLMDEVCEVEKHVNMALLNVIVDTACFTSQPVEQLASHALHHQEVPRAGSDLGEEFISHGDKLCQVAAMASASSMDPKKVRSVRIITSRLEQLMPEVLPAVGAVARHHGNVAAVRHLKGVVQEWLRETEALVQTLDSMTDPTITLNVTEQRIRQGVNVVRGKICDGDREGVKVGIRLLLAHALRMTQVATRVIDQHTNPIFRNGLRVFVQQLLAARRGVKEASEALLEDLSHSRLADTLHRRLAILIDAAADVRQGIKGDNHLDVLNPARQNVYRRNARVAPVKPPRGKNTRTNREACTQKTADAPNPTTYTDSASTGNVTTTVCTEPTPREATPTSTTQPPTVIPPASTTAVLFNAVSMATGEDRSNSEAVVPAVRAKESHCGSSFMVDVAPSDGGMVTNCHTCVPGTTVNCCSVFPASAVTTATMVNCNSSVPAAVVEMAAPSKCSSDVPAAVVAMAAPSKCSSDVPAAVVAMAAPSKCSSGVPAAVVAMAAPSMSCSGVPTAPVSVATAAYCGSVVGCKAGEGERGGGQCGRKGSCQRNKDRCAGLGHQKEETSGLVCGVGDSVVVSAMRGEKEEVARWSSDILGWTSHLGEVGLSMLTHCHHISRKPEMQHLISDVDRLAPLLMESARFVSMGDTSQTDSLRLLADDWVNACQRLVIVMDVAVGDWLLLMDSITQAVNGHDTTVLKSLLSSLDRTQREMHQLLTRAQQLDGRQVVGGSDLIQFFRDADPELDSLTATLRTTADCLANSEDSNSVSKTQLNQRGREWCVLMTCVVSRLDWVTDTICMAGQTTLGISAASPSPTSIIRPSASTHTKLVPVLKAETERIKTVLGFLTSGSDLVVKQRGESLAKSLSSLLEEVVEVAQTPVDDPNLPQLQLFARLDAGLARSRWTEKALDAVQFVRRHCHRYCVPITNLIHSTGLPGVDAVPPEVSQLQGIVKHVSQRTLQAITLSSDLQHRATVRRCLDNLLALLPNVAEAATDYLAGIGGEKGARDVQRASLQWGATVHCLITTLRVMDNVKPATVNELEKQLSGQLSSETLAPTSHLNTSHPLPTFSNSHNSSNSFFGPHMPVARHPAPWFNGEVSGFPRERGRQRDCPSTIATQVEGPYMAARPNQSLTAGEGEASAMSMSPYRSSALYTSWLASAQYLGEEVLKWEVADNHFVKLVQTMAQHCQHMADFARGGTTLRDSEEVSSTGLSLAARGRELHSFTQSLLAMCPQHRSATDLRVAANRISTYSNQLHMVATVLHNAPGHPQGDCILARNAANLVESVRHMFSIAEGIAVAGELMPRENNETDRQVVDLLTRWQHKLSAYHSQQCHNPQLDDLGLRRMELHNPPSLTSLLDQ